jgi:hypothetical protein
MLFLGVIVHSSRRGCFRSSGLDSSAQHFLRMGVMCYCVVLNRVGVVTILTMYAPLTVGSSPCLYETNNNKKHKLRSKGRDYLPIPHT